MKRPRRLRRTTLAVRITVTFAAGALLVSTGLALSTIDFTLNLLTHQQERDALRQSYLNAALARTQLEARASDVPRVLDGLTTPAGSDAVVVTSGRWYSSSLLLSRDTVPMAIRRDALIGKVVWQWADIANRPFIVVGVPLLSSQSTYFQFFDQSTLQRTRSVLSTVLIIAASAATIAGAAVGYVVSRRLTTPLRAVGDAAQRITAGELTLRLPAEHDPELSQLVTNFNQMVDTLAVRIERDARFAADVSHELRSPLTTLSTSLTVLNARSSELSPTGQDALKLLTGETARFFRLVDDLLEISRSDHAGDDLEPVRLGQLLLNLLEQPKNRTVRAEFSGEALDAFVLGDKRRLQQVFNNLLDNAATHAGGATQLSMQVDGARVVVRVDDAGPGIPSEDRDRIFERFTRSRAARASTTGTGLGLALVREHVTAHGGTVEAADSPSGGARLLVDLPRWTP